MAIDLASFVRDVQDFPAPGISFKDITPLLGDPVALQCALDGLAGPFVSDSAPVVDKVAGIEARGFVLATPVAVRLRAGFIPIRKAGKLPFVVAGVNYGLEYGTDRIEIHTDAIAPGERVLIVDDVLATGGTAAAAVQLIQGLGGVVVAAAFLIELTFLGGRSVLPPDIPVHALLTY